MMTVTFVCAAAARGKNGEAYYNEAYAEYEKRLGAFCRPTSVTCGESDAEILAAIPKNAYVIALCIDGRQFSSEEFADKLNLLAVGGNSSVAFVIGGSDGFGQAVRDRADLRMSFSKMTFPHRLMKVILAEQVYRAFTILNNIKYHK